mmetsp:Transcript_20221/g.61579  ORF Transcript_20221/g.61579 Transcript_20221/m.61579 type:complete len:83 (-) Transcript_20221:1325-1573(-)
MTPTGHDDTRTNGANIAYRPQFGAIWQSEGLRAWCSNNPQLQPIQDYLCIGPNQRHSKTAEALDSWNLVRCTGEKLRASTTT